MVDTNSTSLSCPLCCQELLQHSEVNPAMFFDFIVTRDESWIHYYDPLRQFEAKIWKRLREQSPTRLRQERSSGKMMMTFYSPNICNVEPRLMVLLMHQSLNGCVLSLWRNGAEKLSVEWCFFMTTLPFTHVHAAILQVGFIELNHWAYSPDTAPSDSHLSSKLKKFVRLKNFRSDDEAVTTVD